MYSWLFQNQDYYIFLSGYISTKTTIQQISKSEEFHFRGSSLPRLSTWQMWMLPPRVNTHVDLCSTCECPLHTWGASICEYTLHIPHVNSHVCTLLPFTCLKSGQKQSVNHIGSSDEPPISHLQSSSFLKVWRYEGWYIMQTQIM